MAWSLDEKRFREEVFTAVRDHGWDPRSNLFRCFQLPLDVSDPADVAAAFKAVRAVVNRNSKTGTNAGPAKVLQSVLKEAEAVLTDPARRKQHRAEVLADRTALQAALRDDLGGMPAIPAAALARLVEARQRFHTRDEVAEALAAIGCRVREPVELPSYDRPPTKWKNLQSDIVFLGLPSVHAYLQKHFGSATAVTTQKLLDRQTTIQRTAAGDVLTAEMSVVSNLKTWVADGQLLELLGADLLRRLAAEEGMGSDRLAAAIKAPETAKLLSELGLPAANDVAYALLCARRYPAEAAASWQSDYREARADRDLRAARDILAANRGDLDKQLAAELDALIAEIADVDAALQRARALERDDVEAAAQEYARVLQRCRDPEVDSALRRCRPAAPARASAEVGGESVTVTWTPSTARAGEITYRVMRQVAGGGAGDGMPVGTGLTGLTVVDVDVGLEVVLGGGDVADPRASGRRQRSTVGVGEWGAHVVHRRAVDVDVAPEIVHRPPVGRLQRQSLAVDPRQPGRVRARVGRVDVAAEVVGLGLARRDQRADRLRARHPHHGGADPREEPAPRARGRDRIGDPRALAAHRVTWPGRVAPTPQREASPTWPGRIALWAIAPERKRARRAECFKRRQPRPGESPSGRLLPAKRARRAALHADNLARENRPLGDCSQRNEPAGRGFNADNPGPGESPLGDCSQRNSAAGRALRRS